MFKRMKVNLQVDTSLFLVYVLIIQIEKKKQRLLLSLTIVAVVIGLVAGFILSKYKISADSMELIGFPGKPT